MSMSTVAQLCCKSARVRVHLRRQTLQRPARGHESRGRRRRTRSAILPAASSPTSLRLLRCCSRGALRCLPAPPLSVHRFLQPPHLGRVRLGSLSRLLRVVRRCAVRAGCPLLLRFSGFRLPLRCGGFCILRLPAPVSELRLSRC